MRPLQLIVETIQLNIANLTRTGHTSLTILEYKKTNQVSVRLFVPTHPSKVTSHILDVSPLSPCVTIVCISKWLGKPIV